MLMFSLCVSFISGNDCEVNPVNIFARSYTDPHPRTSLPRWRFPLKVPLVEGWRIRQVLLGGELFVCNRYGCCLLLLLKYIFLIKVSLCSCFLSYCNLPCIISNLAPSALHHTHPASIFHDDNDDIIKWKHFPRYWPLVRRIHRSRWIPHAKASDAEFLCFLWSASE